MTTLLDVFATPRHARSRTQKVREAFLDGYRQKHPGFVHVPIDLAAVHAELPVFDEWDIEAKFEMAYGEGKLDEVAAKRWDTLVRYTDQLHACDTLVVSTPMWNFSVPWMLKRWIDTVVQGRLTFEFADGQFKGLLAGRRAVILTTRDGAYGPNTLHAGLDFEVPYLKTVLGFMGFSPIDVVIGEPMTMAGPQEGAKALEAAMLEARNFGLGA
jgi:FMN-dependent NADH-azoreductase